MATPLEAAAAKNNLPMSDLVVLDLTRARAEPTCVRMLADWGAQVLDTQGARKYWTPKYSRKYWTPKYWGRKRKYPVFKYWTPTSIQVLGASIGHPRPLPVAACGHSIVCVIERAIARVLACASHDYAGV